VGEREYTNVRSNQPPLTDKDSDVAEVEPESELEKQITIWMKNR